jgi:hypothetical protein
MVPMITADRLPNVTEYVTKCELGREVWKVPAYDTMNDAELEHTTKKGDALGTSPACLLVRGLALDRAHQQTARDIAL